MDTTTVSGFDICRLRKWIQQALQLPDGAVIGGWLPENPHQAFITVDVINQSVIGTVLRQFDGSTEHLTASVMSQISLSCYGKNALAMALKIKVLLQSNQAIDFCKGYGWGIVRCSDVRNLTATLAGDYEERGQFDCFISHHHMIDTPLAPIEQADIQANHLQIKVRRK